MRNLIRRHNLPALLMLALLTISCGLQQGCVKSPPAFTPSGQAAWYGLQAVKSLDLLRDVSIQANAQTPPLLSEDTTRKVVLYHKAAVSTIGATPSGWKATVLAGLTELEPAIPETERGVLAPYIRLLKSILETIP